MAVKRLRFYDIVGYPRSFDDWRFVWYWRLVHFGCLFTKHGRHSLRIERKHVREYRIKSEMMYDHVLRLSSRDGAGWTVELNVGVAMTICGASALEVIGKALAELRLPCCERDHDRDGNCDRHSAPGMLRAKFPPEEFNPVPPLHVGTWTAEVRDRIWIRIEDTDGGGDDYLDSIFLESVEEARALRDWLNRALPVYPVEVTEWSATSPSTKIDGDPRCFEGIRETINAAEALWNASRSTVSPKP